MHENSTNQSHCLGGWPGSQHNKSFPPPPWEAQPVDDNGSVSSIEYPHSRKATQLLFTHVQNGPYPQGPQPIENDQQVVGVYIQPIISRSQISAFNGQVSLSNRLNLASQTFYGGSYGAMLSQQPAQMAALHHLHQFPGYGRIQPQGSAQYLEQHMYGLSIRDDDGIRNSSYQVSTSSNVSPHKPSKPEDNLFGDLVDFANFKSIKPTSAAAGSRWKLISLPQNLFAPTSPPLHCFVMFFSLQFFSSFHGVGSRSLYINILNYGWAFSAY